MSILPAYLSSFSNVPTLQRSMAERLGLDRTEKSEKNDTTEQNGQISGPSTETQRSHDSLVVRSGDIASDYGDVLSLSSQPESKSEIQSAEASSDAKLNEKSDANSAQASKSSKDTLEELSDEEKQQVSELQQRDIEVKAHEAAHLAAAGGLAQGSASYEYQEGPDGNSYAVGGEVSIDTSPVEGDPEATITKSQQIRNAALAPASPSSQDYKVAAAASQMEAQAREELAKDQQVTQESITTSENPRSTSEAEAIAKNNSTQLVSPNVIAKYAANSMTMSFRTQPDFERSLSS